MLTNHYLLPNECGKRILYTYIRKNACSSFKRYMYFRLTDPSGVGLAKYRELKIDPKGFDLSDLDVSIFVYRDPVDRVISTFVNKFVEGRGASDIYARMHIADDDAVKKHTFGGFVNYVMSTRDFRELDPHLWPQAAHLIEIEYTHPISMDRLHEQMSQFLAPGSADAFSGRANASGGNGQLFEGDLSTATVADIQGLISDGKRVSKTNFRTAQLVEALEARYEQDVAMIKRIQEGFRAPG